MPVPDACPDEGWDMGRFNRWLGQRITDLVGTMWTAYAFAALALVSLPGALGSHDAVVIVSWIAQTFLQLVLLSIIMVGQGIQAEGTETVIRETHDTVIAELAELRVIVEELRELTGALHARTLTERDGN